MVDRTLLASKIASIQDAVTRIREVLPVEVSDFAADRTAREVVALNLMVAIQDTIDLASHWIADEGWAVPQSYRDVFQSLADHGVISTELAATLAAAAGLRNLVAHRYGDLDWARIHAAAQHDLAALEALCSAMASA